MEKGTEGSHSSEVIVQFFMSDKASADNERLDQLLHQYFQIGQESRAKKKKTRSHPKRNNRNQQIVEPSSVITPELARRHIKRFLKQLNQPSHIERVRDTIMYHLSYAKNNHTLLILILELCEELFVRSAVFRSLLAAQTSVFFEKLLDAAGASHANIRTDKIASSDLSLMAVLALIENWKNDYGSQYPTLIAGHAVLVGRGFHFPQVKEREAQAKKQEEAVAAHERRVNHIRREQIIHEMTKFVPEMENLIIEMHRVFDILVPTMEAFHLAMKEAEDAVEEETLITNPPDTGNLATKELDDEEDGVDWEDVEASKLSPLNDQLVDDEELDINEMVQDYGLGSASYQLTITISTNVCTKSEENQVLFQSLADGILQIRKRFLPLVNDWLHIIHSCETPDNGSELLRLEDLRDRLQNVTMKWETLVQESERKQFATIRPVIVPTSSPQQKRNVA